MDALRDRQTLDDLMQALKRGELLSKDEPKNGA
jgi:hypothetical protein